MVSDVSRSWQQEDERERLTPRENEIVRLLVDGYTTTTIASRLFLSIRTVNNYLRSCYIKAKIPHTLNHAHALISWWWINEFKINSISPHLLFILLMDRIY